MAIIDDTDPELASIFTNNNVEPFFALSWLLTWFAHDVDNLDEAARLFDLMLATSPIMPLYVAVVVLTGARESLLDPSVSGEHCLLHSRASRLHVFGTHSADEVARKAILMMKKWSVAEVEKRTGYKLPRSCAYYIYPFPWMTPAFAINKKEAGRTNGLALVVGIIALGFAMMAGDDVIELINQALTN